MSKRRFSILRIMAVALIAVATFSTGTHARQAYLATCLTDSGACHPGAGAATLNSSDCNACHHHGNVAGVVVSTDKTTYTTAENILFKFAGGSRTGRARLEIYNVAGTTRVAKAFLAEDGSQTMSVPASTFGPLTSTTLKAKYFGANCGSTTCTLTLHASGPLLSTAAVTITQPPTTGTIAGTVTNATGGAAIAGATVSTVPATTTVTTAANGTYTIPNVAPGTYTVNVSATGFVAGTASGVVVTAGATTTRNFALTPTTGTIAGTVTNATGGAAIAGATVSTVPATSTVTTGTNGSYTIANVPAGTYTVNVSATGFVNGTASGVVVTAGATTTRNFALTPTTGTIAGTVTNATGGAAISGATVSTVPATSTVTTGTNGTYTIANVAPGTYTVNVSATGFNPGTASGVVVTAGATTTRNFALTPVPTNGTIAGTVTNATGGAGIVGATVSTVPATSTVTTGTGGAYTIPNVPAGTYTVNVSATGFNPGTASGVVVTAGATTTRNFALTPVPTNGTIAGTVTNATTGAAIAGATVSTVPVTTTVTTGSNGSYTIVNVPAGVYTITISAPGFTPITLTGVVVTAGATTTQNVALVPLVVGAGTIAGVVTDPGTLAPVAGATVATNTGGYSALTAANGSYSIPNVIAGSYTLTVSKTGYTSTVVGPITVTANTTTTVNINLPVTVSGVPPPVRQVIGFADRVTSTLVEADCRACHDNPSKFPGIMPNLIARDRHHILTNPPPTGNGDACTLCHTMYLDPVTLTYTPIVVRNCLQCHSAGTGSPHHNTTLAITGDCQHCHGTKVVSNNGDGHYIPTYAPSMVTPYLSGGTGPVTNSRGNKSGACNFCHDSGTDVSTGVPLLIGTNMDTHHGTGLSNCAWCHVNGDPAYLPLNYRIRACENCHGPETLHNIQVSSISPSTPINPGYELPNFGHIGADADCKGCHGPQAVAAYTPAPYSGPTAVTLSALSANVVPAGVATVLGISGSGFVNLINAPDGSVITVTSKAQLTSAAGVTTLLTPSYIDASYMTVTIPAATALGNYTLNVVKVNSLDGVLGASGPKALIVVTPVTIASAAATNNILTIVGSGFGAQPTSGGKTVDTVSVKGVACKVTSWTNTQIVATCGAVSNGDPVYVATLLNAASATATVVAANKPPVAVATVTPTTAKIKANITFDGTKSSDPDGTIASWSWNLGNGTTKTGSKFTYAYTATGTYTVTLTVTDNKGATGTATVKVTITK